MLGSRIPGNRALATFCQRSLSLAPWLAVALFSTPGARAAGSDASKSKPALQGVASWHVPDDNSRAACRTASQRPWKNNEFVAAHRTLPLGSKVRVVNLNNNRSVIVEITDRGPYCRGRIIDLSLVAAIHLGMVSSGTARVRLEPFDAGQGVSAALVAPGLPLEMLAMLTATAQGQAWSGASAAF